MAIIISLVIVTGVLAARELFFYINGTSGDSGEPYPVKGVDVSISEGYKLGRPRKREASVLRSDTKATKRRHDGTADTVKTGRMPDAQV